MPLSHSYGAGGIGGGHMSTNIQQNVNSSIYGKTPMGARHIPKTPPGSGGGGAREWWQGVAQTPPPPVTTTASVWAKGTNHIQQAAPPAPMRHVDYGNTMQRGAQATTPRARVHTQSPVPSAPPQPHTRGRERYPTNAQKYRTTSPVHIGGEPCLPRSTSPAPPKRVFSSPPAGHGNGFDSDLKKDNTKGAGTNNTNPYQVQAPTVRRPSMLWDGMSQFIIAPQTEEDKGKYCVVLDLDETLVYAREGPIQCRPGYKELMRVLGACCETVVWTAGERSYAKEVLKQIDGAGSIRHCIYRHHLWFNGQLGQVKDLRLLGRDPDKVLLVENTPDCLRKNATQAVLVPDFRGKDDQGILTLLTLFIKDLFKSGKPVAQHLRASPLITPREVCTNVGDTIICHTIGESEQNFQHRAPNPDTLPSYTTTAKF